MQSTPLSKSGKTIEPYFLQTGRGRIFITTSVMTPRVPSEPSTTWLKSGPMDTLGPWVCFSSTPVGVTIRTCTNRSSMLPYVFFFIPDALVATQPPRLENSCESGSCPVVNPCFFSSFSRSWPIIPDSMQATRFCLSSHKIRFCENQQSKEIV